MTIAAIRLVGSASHFLGSDGFSVRPPSSMSNPRIENGLPRHSQERRLGLEPFAGLHLFKKLGRALWYFFASVNVLMTGPQVFSHQPNLAALHD